MQFLWDCCCLFNPFYAFPEESTDSEELRQREPMLDAYRLPPEWNAMRQYHAAFDTLDSQFEAALDATSAYTARPSPRVDPSRVARALEILAEGEVGARELQSEFNLLRLAISEHPPLSAERARLIGQYELYRDIRSRGDEAARQEAMWWLEDARSPKHGAEQRVLFYQKALYFTHRHSEKAALRCEYEQFCERLK
jgi:hypothetical protein